MCTCLCSLMRPMTFALHVVRCLLEPLGDMARRASGTLTLCFLLDLHVADRPAVCSLWGCLVTHLENIQLCCLPNTSLGRGSTASLSYWITHLPGSSVQLEMKCLRRWEERSERERLSLTGLGLTLSRPGGLTVSQLVELTAGVCARLPAQDVLVTLLNNLKVQERQNRVCTTVAIAIVAETCSPFTVLPALMNEYKVRRTRVHLCLLLRSALCTYAILTLHNSSDPFNDWACAVVECQYIGVTAVLLDDSYQWLLRLLMHLSVVHLTIGRSLSCRGQ